MPDAPSMRELLGDDAPRKYDALGHAGYDGQLWNRYDARSTIGAMEKASVLPIAAKGAAGRGVLTDMARHRGKESLEKGETFDHTDLEAAAEAQGVWIEPHDILVVRTGWMRYWYELDDPDSFFAGFCEPGADACAADDRWTFLYVAAPLKVVSGTGAPVNPVAIR